jgi:magnesium transporter
MLTIYESNGKGLKVHDQAEPITGNCIWIDLMQPTPEEDRFVEEVLGVDIPTRAEMREIEPSNRFYQERGAYFMTASIVYNIEAPVPSTSPVVHPRRRPPGDGALRRAEAFPLHAALKATCR